SKLLISITMRQAAFQELTRVYDNIQAEMLRSRLENHGIACHLFDQSLTQIAPHYTSGQGGIRLMVDPVDYDAARVVLGPEVARREEETASRNARNLALGFGLLLGLTVSVALVALVFGSIG
ncbi:MAG: DUF2007 domain-containing protein, partial [Bacteroidota bacterium]